MKVMFGRGLSINLRLVVALVLSVLLIVNNDRLAPGRYYLTTLLSPLQYLASSPLELMDWVAESLKSREQLHQENHQYQQRELELAAQLQRLSHLQEENQRLRALLGSPVSDSFRKMIARVQSVDSNPFSLQVVINKGKHDGVYEGQPVLDESGVVGQVLYVGRSASRVLLIADSSHAIPVRNQRNDVRLVAVGKGDIHQLELQYVTKSADVKIGDLLVTSGLGGRFPEGYPVARVVNYSRDEQQVYAQVKLAPVAALDRARYLLLVWPQEGEATTEDVSVATTPTQKGTE